MNSKKNPKRSPWAVNSPFNNHQHLNPFIKQSTEMSVLNSGKAEKKYFPLLSYLQLSNSFILWLCGVMLPGLFCSHVMLSANHDMLILSSITKHYSGCKPQIHSAGHSLHMNTKGLQKSFPHEASTIFALNGICFDEGYLQKDLHEFCIMSERTSIFSLSCPQNSFSFFF